MMKKLIFCLLVLTGAGMLNSCQQDEVVSEAPASKGVTIRASLPNDAQSRVELGNTEGTRTSLYWESTDKITATINGNGGYEFEIVSIGADKTTATFRYTNNNSSLPTGQCTFTYGATPEIGMKQDGTKEGLKTYHRMETETITITDWNAVNSVVFTTKVALVEISLPSNIQAKVSLYDTNTGARLVYTDSKQFSDNKVYFALPHETACKGFVLAEISSNTAYVAAVGQNTLQGGKLYRITKEMSSVTFLGISKDNIKYFNHDGAVYICGYGNEQSKIETDCFKEPSNKELFKSKVIKMLGVKTIGERAFYDCGVLTVTIPATVTNIENSAFQFCNSATDKSTFTFLGTTPPTLGSSALGSSEVPKVIYVPSTLVNVYKNATGWSAYADKIQAIQ